MPGIFQTPTTTVLKDLYDYTTQPSFADKTGVYLKSCLTPARALWCYPQAHRSSHKPFIPSPEKAEKQQLAAKLAGLGTSPSAKDLFCAGEQFAQDTSVPDVAKSIRSILVMHMPYKSIHVSGAVTSLPSIIRDQQRRSYNQLVGLYVPPQPKTASVRPA